jgi:hypothetical protein
MSEAPDEYAFGLNWLACASAGAAATLTPNRIRPGVPAAERAVACGMCARAGLAKLHRTPPR